VKLPAVTMVYNKVDYTDLWCRHFANQIDVENRYVIDHGSDDGTTDDLGAVNVIRIPRGPYDVAEQSRLVSELSNELLGPVINSVGLDVWHLADTEAPIALTRAVSPQRGWPWFNSALCQPATIR
jgi:hypothetical protein